MLHEVGAPPPPGDDDPPPEGRRGPCGPLTKSSSDGESAAGDSLPRCRCVACPRPAERVALSDGDVTEAMPIASATEVTDGLCMTNSSGRGLATQDAAPVWSKVHADVALPVCLGAAPWPRERLLAKGALITGAAMSAGPTGDAVWPDVLSG